MLLFVAVKSLFQRAAAAAAVLIQPGATSLLSALVSQVDNTILQENTGLVSLKQTPLICLAPFKVCHRRRTRR